MVETIWGCWSFVQQRQGQGRFTSCLSPPCTAAGQSLPALGPCRVGMEVGQALCLGTRRKPWESSMLLPCPPARPSALLAVSAVSWPGDRAELHPEELRALVGPACQHSQGLLSWSTVPWGASCAGFEGVPPVQRSCRACPGMPVAAAGGARALCCSAGQGACSGQGTTACLPLGTGLTSSPGPWPAALTSQRPVSHMQPYLLAWSCLQGSITSGQSTRWCSAAGSSHAALQRGQAQELPQP